MSSNRQPAASNLSLPHGVSTPAENNCTRAFASNVGSNCISGSDDSEDARPVDKNDGQRRNGTGSRSIVAGRVVNHVTGLLAKRCALKSTTASSTTASTKISEAICDNGSTTVANTTQMMTGSRLMMYSPSLPSGPGGASLSLSCSPPSSSRPPPSPRPLQTGRQSSIGLEHGSPGSPIIGAHVPHPLSSSNESASMRCFSYGGDKAAGGERSQAGSTDNSACSEAETFGVGFVESSIAYPGDGATSTAKSSVATSPTSRSSSSGVSSSSPRGAGGRNRFKKILRPLRRTRSAGSGEDLNNPEVHARNFGLLGPFGRRSASTKSASLTPPSVARVKDSSKGHRPLDIAASSDSDIDESVASASSSSSVKETSSRRPSLLLFSFLRRHSDSSPAHERSAAVGDSSSACNQSAGPTTDTLRRWGESLDQLLADEYGRSLFGEFLKGEFSEENLDFWLACEQYRTSSSVDSLPSLANDIYADFVVAKAPREINLDSTTRQQTAVNVLHPDRSTFQPAQKRIQALMERDSYRRFLESEVYSRLLSGKAPLTPPTAATSTAASGSGSNAQAEVAATSASRSPRSSAIGPTKVDKRR